MIKRCAMRQWRGLSKGERRTLLNNVSGPKYLRRLPRDDEWPLWIAGAIILMSVRSEYSSKEVKYYLNPYPTEHI